jgi:hypothetical protein
MGLALTLASIVLFALWATLHVVVVLRVGRVSVAKAALCLVLPPATIAYGQEHPKLLTAWTVAIVAYASILVLALTVEA